MDNKELAKRFSRNLEDLLDAEGLFESEFADRIGISKTAVSMYLKGRRVPKLVILMRISKEFNVSIDSLFE